MTPANIPPCPVCGVVPIMSIYQSENRIDGCKCIQWPIPCTQEYWGLWCDEAIGRHTRANLGITTIAQLNELLAPDPRVAVLDRLGLLTLDQIEAVLVCAKAAVRASKTEGGIIITEDVTAVIDSIIAAQRGEGI